MSPDAWEAWAQVPWVTGSAVATNCLDSCVSWARGCSQGLPATMAGLKCQGLF